MLLLLMMMIMMMMMMMMMMMLVTLVDPATRVLMVEQRLLVLAVLLEVQRARALRERALVTGRGLKRTAEGDRALLELFMTPRDFAADDVVLLLTARLGLNVKCILYT